MILFKKLHHCSSSHIKKKPQIQKTFIRINKKKKKKILPQTHR